MIHIKIDQNRKSKSTDVMNHWYVSTCFSTNETMPLKRMAEKTRRINMMQVGPEHIIQTESLDRVL